MSSNRSYRAGVGRVTITPPLSAPHASWGAQTHIFPDGIETDLWCTVLVIEDGHEMAAFVDTDLILFTAAEAAAIRAAAAAALGIPEERIRVASTHNHAGPPPSAWNWVKDGRDVLERYYGLLPAQCAGAARAALHNLRPARVAAGSGHSRVGVNRRQDGPNGRTICGVNFDGVTDPHVFVLRIDAAEGTPLAALVGYTMHPTTLGPTNRRVSADWPGHLKRTVEALTGATCLFAQGATGDVGPGPEGYTDDPRVIRKLGAMVGCEAARVYLGLHVPAVQDRFERVWESGAPLGKWMQVPEAEPAPIVRAWSRTIRVPLRPQPTVDEAEARLRDAQERLDELVGAGAPQAEVEAATFVVKRANMAMTRARTFGGQRDFPLELHLLQIGPAVLAGLPVEPFVETALAVKAASPFPHTWFGGYTGAWYGYLPVESEYRRGGYEVDTSPFAPHAARIVAEQTVSALNELYAAWDEAGS